MTRGSYEIPQVRIPPTNPPTRSKGIAGNQMKKQTCQKALLVFDIRLALQISKEKCLALAVCTSRGTPMCSKCKLSLTAWILLRWITSENSLSFLTSERNTAKPSCPITVFEFRNSFGGTRGNTRVQMYLILFSDSILRYV